MEERPRHISYKIEYLIYAYKILNSTHYCVVDDMIITIHVVLKEHSFYIYELFILELLENLSINATLLL